MRKMKTVLLLWHFLLSLHGDGDLLSGWVFNHKKVGKTVHTVKVRVLA
jgi:hypothetical protein